MRHLRSLLIGQAGRVTPAMAGPDLPRPDLPCYIVGDIHGRADLLETMLDLIDAHIGGTGAVDPQLVFVGDYIDHGPDSAAVVARLRALTLEFPGNVTCLMGNHERMLLDFMLDPTARGPRWLRQGGAATLASYGLDPVGLDQGATAPAWADAAARLAEAVGEATHGWIADRPLVWHSGNLWAVHAGADPLRPMTDQSTRVLLWGHPEFDTTPRRDDAWVAHGHVEQSAPSLSDGRIGLDTGAWSTGRLTAVAIRPDGSHAFLQT
jgi:serine/threonine protein phosphatase 1